ncbi:SDR family oxidoreductase [Aspergillus novofumigatus IBT 16806]|uniref:NAD(P)-binding protein n=1 Tax=Aspergillus novofumigatus (strain IBT 16806) TaxID=1392255 RepID=A0A2I1BVP2_ASPN1|nr:NAD(P)-binding protein [Aspergillus novofumigatus IBT 16806]PKX89463.1 NAD(P)-binding protein [Aspergillus novofumigatus IBT 16806]
MHTTILITGGNRGLGKALVATYLLTPNTTVIATIRDPSKSKSLSALAKASGSSLVTIELDIASANSIATAVETIEAHKIGALDVVIANAGISGPTPSLVETQVSELQKYIDVNAYGPFQLFKAVHPLLRPSTATSKPKFVLISSVGGSLTTMNNFMPIAGYGASKALSNFLFKWLALDNKDIIIWAQNPGNVDTDMARDGLDLLKSSGLDLSSVRFASPEESARAIKNVIDDATTEMSGKFVDHDGSELAW